METKILIVEDQALIRKCISALIKSHFSNWDVYEAANGIQAIFKANEVHPDIILMDYRMPIMDGLRASVIILENLPETKIIMVTAEENSEFMFDAVDARICGIVSKTSTDIDLLNAICNVKNGKAYLNSIVSDKITQHLYQKKRKKIKSRHLNSSLLSDRELEILNLLSKGNSSAEIGIKLFISKRTVDSHKANIIKKCQVRSTPDLVRYAIAKNLIDT
jgi:two-component system, NarL family, response regulator NreC